MTRMAVDQPGYYDADLCDLSDFAATVLHDVDPAHVPHASSIEKNVPIYDCAALRSMLEASETRRILMAEWTHLLQHGAGVVVLQGAYADTAPLDAATEIFEAIIAEEKAAGVAADHFATAGANDRIWNALQKLCLAAPHTFLRYFANPMIDAVCEAWLGPNYQMTAQVNVVRPGGLAQQAHRDYHLGFQTAEVSAAYPAHIHDLSPLLTLQGGIAHCDMPLESGPTKLLPFSQRYRPGYVAWRRDDFRAFFEDHFVQLPLAKGDALFFNPALFHAAGENRSADIQRMVNLLQVSSAFGRAMEAVDRAAMCAAVFDPLMTSWAAGRVTEAEVDAALAATADGYAFPTNLDRDPPADGLAPQTQRALLKEAILSGLDRTTLLDRLLVQSARRDA
ncbi:MAG: phytanoyl-CoA dioxygenase family protein [Pseudomonadota bacterium]